MRKIIFSILSIGVLLGCNDNYEGIPDVPVNVYINTLDPNFQHLNGLGSWAHVEGGSKGIIVFHYDLNKYVAYERHCTFSSSDICSQVSVDQTNLFATDTCCGSKFQLLDGVPIEGSATIPLKKYNTSFDGNIIRIWN